jgi:hypothetical protein
VESLKVPGKILPTRLICCALLLSAFAAAADPPIVPVTVCEILADLPAHEGKDYAVLGRYSFRRDGRWIGEEMCGPAQSATASAAPGTIPAVKPAMLWLTEDAGEAPRPPGDFELDASALNKKFADMVKHTSLGKFRFGNPEYDRWAVVYGRVVARKGEDTKRAPADLVFRGNGVVIFLTTEK